MKYTQEMREFILKNYKGLYSKELADRLNERFKTNITAKQIASYKKRNQLRSGMNGQFTKGHTPSNKGQQMSEETYRRCQPTMFKKGSIPPNYKPVGTERLTKDGYIEIKVADHGKWKLKHVLVWEQQNGPVPKGYAVVMLDRNRLNTDISNLRLIKRRELLIMNRQGLFTEDAELNNTAMNLAKLMDSVAKKGRKNV